MKRILYSLAGIVLLASCAKEAVQDPQCDNTYVPLNITVQTKAGGSGSGSGHDINSIRIVAFKDSGTPSTDLVVLNEYYGFGFGEEDKGTAGRYTVSVKPTLELDVNTDKYYVYAVLNEDEYRVILSGTDTTSVKSNLESLSSREEMVNLLNTPAVYPAKGIKDAPVCLMAGCKELDFSPAGAKDRPMDVHFGLYEEDAENPAPLDRTMAQITVESIQSVESTTIESDMALLPKIFVLDVKLVNVPSGIAWGSEGGVTGGTVELPIGKATAADTVKVSGGSDVISNYYPRVWDGNVYKDVDVSVDCEQVTTARYFRTTKDTNDGWAFFGPDEVSSLKYTYQQPATAPTDPGMPYGFPTKGGDGKYQCIIKKNDTDNKNGDKKAKFEESLAQYLAALPHDPNNGGAYVDIDDVNAYLQYLEELDDYNDASRIYPYAVAGLEKMDVQYISGNAVYKLVNTDLPNIFSDTYKTYLSTNKFTVKSMANPQPSSYVEYCSKDRWKVNLGDSYYVPENIQTSATDATCIYVKLAYAAPTITIPSNIDVKNLPEAGEATGGTFTYWFDNYYHKQNDALTSELTRESFDLTSYKANVDQLPKIHISKLAGDGKKYAKPDEAKYSVATMFNLHGLVVDADDETIECTAATTNNKYHVYIDGEHFRRTGTGLTATTTVDNNQDGTTFNWNIPTTGTKVKEFYIPVNNAQFGSDYSVRRNTKYTVKLTVGAATLSKFPSSTNAGSRKPSEPELSISASVTSETMTENED